MPIGGSTPSASSGALAVTAWGNITGAQAVALPDAAGGAFTGTLTGNVTVGAPSGASSGAESRLSIKLTQDGTGGRTVAWNAAFVWLDGSAPTMPTSAGDIMLVDAVSLDGGTTWYAAASTPGAFRGCRVRNSANQTITTATPTAITFDTEDFDTDGFHSTASNTSRFTIPSGLGGKYLIEGNVQYDSTNAPNGTYRDAWLRLNGTDIIDIKRLAPPDGTSALVGVSTTFALAAGDYVELLANHDRGSDLATVAGAKYSPWFAVTRLGS